MTILTRRGMLSFIEKAQASEIFRIIRNIRVLSLSLETEKTESQAGSVVFI
jgi:hypothetical protein